MGIYIVARDGGKWKNVTIQEGVGGSPVQATFVDKKSAVRSTRAKAKSAARRSGPPETTLFVSLSASRAIQEVSKYGNLRNTVSGEVKRNPGQPFQYGVHAVLETGQVGGPLDIILSHYLTKHRAGENVKKINKADRE